MFKYTDYNTEKDVHVPGMLYSTVVRSVDSVQTL